MGGVVKYALAVLLAWKIRSPELQKLLIDYPKDKESPIFWIPQNKKCHFWVFTVKNDWALREMELINQRYLLLTGKVQLRVIFEKNSKDKDAQYFKIKPELFKAQTRSIDVRIRSRTVQTEVKKCTWIV